VEHAKTWAKSPMMRFGSGKTALRTLIAYPKTMHVLDSLGYGGENGSLSIAEDGRSSIQAPGHSFPQAGFPER